MSNQDFHISFKAVLDQANVQKQIDQAAKKSKELLKVEKEIADINAKVVSSKKMSQHSDKEQEKIIKAKIKASKQDEKLTQQIKIHNLDVENTLRRIKTLQESNNGRKEALTLTTQMATQVEKLRISEGSGTQEALNKRRALQLQKKELTGLNAVYKKTSQTLGEIAAKFAQWISVTTIFFGTTRAIKDMVEQVKILDDALVEISKVTDLTETQLESLTDAMFDLGEETGRTGVEVADAYATFARAGFDIENEIPKLAKYSLMMVNVADGINSTNEASKILISNMKAYGIEAENASKIMDAMNEVANTQAVTFKDLSEITSRSASVAAMDGTTFEQLIGLGTGAQEIINNSEKVGTALKTISMRIRGMNEDGEKVSGLSSEIESMMKSIAGIDVLDENKQIKSMYEVLQLLSEEVDNLSKNELSVILEKLGGKRQGAVLSAIIQNWETVEKSVDSAMNSMGSAARENEKFLDSIQGKMNQFSSEWSRLANETIDSDLIKWFVDFGTESLKATRSIGLLNAAFITLVTYLTITKKLGMVTYFQNLAKQMFVTSAGVEATNFELTKMQATIARITPLMLVLAGIGIVKLFDSWTMSIEEATQSMQKARSVYDESIETIDNLKSEFDILTEVENKSNEETTRMLEIQKELADRFGDSSANLDVYTDSIEENNAAFEEMEKIAARKFIRDSKVAKQTAETTLTETVAITPGVFSTDVISGTREEAVRQANEWLNSQTKIGKEYQKVLEAVQKYEEEISNANSILSDYANAQNIINNNNEELVESSSTLDSVIGLSGDTIATVSSGLSSMASELDELNNLEEMNIETVLELISRYPELIDSIEKTENGYRFEAKAIEALREIKIEEALTAIKMQANITDATDTEINNRIANYSNEYNAINKITEANMRLVATRLAIEDEQDRGLQYWYDVIGAYVQVGKVQDLFIEGVNRSSTAIEDNTDALDNQIDALEDKEDVFEDAHNKIIDAYEDEISLLNEQLEVIKEQREEEERLLAIEEARIKLQTSQSQLNTWTYTEAGGWQLTANPNAVREAQEQYDKLTTAEAQLARDKVIEDQIKVLQDKISVEEDLIKAFKQSIDAQIKALEKLSEQGEASSKQAQSYNPTTSKQVPKTKEIVKKDMKVFKPVEKNPVVSAKISKLDDFLNQKDTGISMVPKNISSGTKETNTSLTENKFFFDIREVNANNMDEFLGSMQGFTPFKK